MSDYFYSDNTDELLAKVVAWAQERNIINGSDLKSQLNKLAEEFGELARGVNKNDGNLISDSIGDMLVVLTIMSEINNKENDPFSYVEDPNDDNNDCHCITSDLELAYNEIKDRKGIMIHGVFVKESPVATNN